MKQELLMAPKVDELSRAEQELVLEAQARIEGDPFYAERNGGFAVEAEAHLAGFCFDRDRSKAFPVYDSVNGLFAVDHHPEEGGVTSWSVEPTLVYG